MGLREPEYDFNKMSEMITTALRECKVIPEDMEVHVQMLEKQHPDYRYGTDPFAMAIQRYWTLTIDMHVVEGRPKPAIEQRPPYDVDGSVEEDHAALQTDNGTNANAGELAQAHQDPR